MENSIGTRIKNRRTELCLTQAQVRQVTGISTGNLSDIENGNKIPSAQALISLSSALDCSIDWILKGELTKAEHDLSHEGDLQFERDIQLLRDFHELPENEKSELIEILQMKLRKFKKEKDIVVKSSRSTSTENNLAV